MNLTLAGSAQVPRPTEGCPDMSVFLFLWMAVSRDREEELGMEDDRKGNKQDPHTLGTGWLVCPEALEV
jgi:hypothetical protein